MCTAAVVAVGAGVSGNRAGVAVAVQPAGTVAATVAGPPPVDRPSTTTVTSPLPPAVIGAGSSPPVTVSSVNGARGGVTVNV